MGSSCVRVDKSAQTLICLQSEKNSYVGGVGGGGGVQPCSILDPENQIQRLSRLGLGGSTCQPQQEVGQIWHPGSKLGTRERP